MEPENDNVWKILIIQKSLTFSTEAKDHVINKFISHPSYVPYFTHQLIEAIKENDDCNDNVQEIEEDEIQTIVIHNNVLFEIYSRKTFNINRNLTLM